MKEIYIKYSDESHRFMIDKYKVLLSKSFDKAQILLKEINKGIEKAKPSEYEEVYNNNSLRIDEVTVDTKRSIAILIHPWIDLSEIAKLTTKSLFYKYLEGCLGEIEMDDLYQTLMHVYEIASSDLVGEKTLMKFDELEFSYGLSPLSVKQIIKLAELIIKKEECYADSSDLTRKETLSLILRTINQTARYAYDLDFFVLFDCIELNDEITCLLNGMPSNVYVVVYPHQISVELKKEEVYIIGKNNVDLFADEDIYEKVMMNQSETNDLHDFKFLLDNIFAKEYNNLYANAIIKRI